LPHGGTSTKETRYERKWIRSAEDELGRPGRDRPGPAVDRDVHVAGGAELEPDPPAAQGDAVALEERPLGEQGPRRRAPVCGEPAAATARRDRHEHDPLRGGSVPGDGLHDRRRSRRRWCRGRRWCDRRRGWRRGRRLRNGVVAEVPCPEQRDVGRECHVHDHEQRDDDVVRTAAHAQRFGRTAGVSCPQTRDQVPCQPRKASSSTRSASGESASSVSRPVTATVWRICSR